MPQVNKLHITKLNPHLTCTLCGGYYIDATTIIECLHSFCKSCIVRYLETNKFCPVCEVQVHKTKPLLNIRQDQTLQNIVYKLVPGLFQNEMRTRKEFYDKHPNQLPANPEDRGEVIDQYIYSSDETICLSLEYASSPEEQNQDDDSEESSARRFLRCPAAVTVGLLKRLVRGKYGLDSNHALDILYGDAFLCDEYSLVDLAYIFSWKRKGPMRLKYRIYQRQEIPRLNGNEVPKAEEKEKPSEEGALPENTQQTKSDNESKESEAPLQVCDRAEMIVSNADATNGVDHKPTSSTDLVRSDTLKEEKKEETTVAVVTKLEATPTETLSSTTNGSSTASSSISPVGRLIKESSSGSKTLKVPPKTSSLSVNSVATKRPCSSTGDDLNNSSESNPTQAKRAVMSSPSKVPTPRFFKMRNSSQTSNATTGNATSGSGPSIASVIAESPVQEVAVNLSKISSSSKKTEKDRSSSKDSYISLSAVRSTTSDNNSSITTRNAPLNPSLKTIQSVVASHKKEEPSKSKAVLNPSSSSSLAIPPNSAWMNMARGLSHPRPTSLPSSFPNHAALSANFLSNLFAHSQYPFLPPQISMSLTQPVTSQSEGKKQSPNSTTSPTSSSLPAALPLKPTSPRSPSGFATPTFSLNALQSYSAGLSPLLPLSRDLVGSFYTSYASRPFGLPIRGSLPKTSPSPSTSSSAGGFHSSLPPTVTTSISSSTSSTVMRKPSPGLRPIVPRRSAPPPPLVPIRSAPLIRSPPTLLPITKSDVEDQSTAKTSPASDTIKSTTIDSRVAQPVHEAKKTSSSDNLIVKPEANEVAATYANHKKREENEKVKNQIDKTNIIEVRKDELEKFNEHENGRVDSVKESFDSSIQNEESVVKKNSHEPIEESKPTDKTSSESLVNSDNIPSTSDEEKSVKATAEPAT